VSSNQLDTDLNYTAQLFCPLPEHYPAPIFGRYLATGELQLLTHSPEKAEIAGWSCIGELIGPSVLKERHSQALIQFKAVSFYQELISRSNRLTEGKLESRHVGFVGTGASINLIKSCARIGITDFSFWDCDQVELANVGRTAYELADIGLSKTRAAHRHILNINPNAQVYEYHGDFLDIAPDILVDQMARCDVIVMGTDTQAVQLLGNQIGYQLKKPMLFPGFYQRAEGGEIVVVLPPGPCYRCQVKTRFEGTVTPPASVSADLHGESGLIFDCDHLDSIVGKLLISLLLKTDVPVFARFFEHLHSHSLIFLKHDPQFLLEGEDIFGSFFSNKDLAFAYESLWFDPSAWRVTDCEVCQI